MVDENFICLNQEVIRKAKGLIFPAAESEGTFRLNSIFFRLSAEMTTRMHSAFLRNASPSDQFLSIQHSRYFENSISRFSDFLNRLNLIRWMHGTFESQTGDDSKYWHLFAGLAVKDFHTDLSSLMDSLAPVIITTTVGVDSLNHDASYLPGFSHLLPDRRRSFWQKLPSDIQSLIHNTADWWSPIKRVRDVLIHKEHIKIIFGNPEDGIWFQNYNPLVKLSSPQIIAEETLCIANGGNQVIDFWKYAAFAFSELIVFSDALGEVLAEVLGGTSESLTECMLAFNCPQIVKALDDLSQNANE
ncbi:MAG: hypothetical protein HF981_07405 [Desulfobacteraceae bacterium]|nr:hypothetical protein [Desulfobacteraceae bacterium]MBC2750195.1 hypothetical protein [Desulfobacteraceae bacterium]